MILWQDNGMEITRKRQWHLKRGPGPVFWWLLFFAVAEALIVLAVFA